jgi:hypothetical protein
LPLKLAKYDVFAAFGMKSACPSMRTASILLMRYRTPTSPATPVSSAS